MSNVFEVQTKAPELALKLDVGTSISLIDKFLDGTGYMIMEINYDEDQKRMEMIIENDALDIEIQCRLDDIIVKGCDGDISAFSQQAFDLRYETVA